MDYINYVKQSPIAGFMGYGGGATNLGFYSSSSVGGPRGIYANGGPVQSSIDFITINTTGNATNFGNLTQARRLMGGCSNGTRGCFAGGYTSFTPSNVIDYITINTESNATDFGDLTMTRHRCGGLGNVSPGRGVFVTGEDSPAKESMDYITIASTGNASDFGDCTPNRWGTGCCASTTRGIIAGGYTPSSGPASTWSSNAISYITIANTGNTTDFGDLQRQKQVVGACDNDTRACFGGGNWQSGNYTDEIVYVTIASTGNSTDFGNMVNSRGYTAGTNDKTPGVDRGVFGGGFDDTAYMTDIDYITISSTGNASDFGDLTTGRMSPGAASGGDAA